MLFSQGFKILNPYMNVNYFIDRINDSVDLVKDAVDIRNIRYYNILY